MKGKGIADGLGSEGMGVFFFVQEFYSSHPYAVVVKIKFPGIIDGMADLDTLPDIGSGDFIKVALEADCGVVVGDPLVSDEEMSPRTLN